MRKKFVDFVGILGIVAFLFSAVPSHSSVGYRPSGTVSFYILDNLANPYQRHVMDFSADPGKVGARPNEHYLDFSDPVVRATFERRYGPNTTSTRFKKWMGPGNEVRSIVSDALSWKYGGGSPSEVEITDAQATGDRVWHEFLMATQDGWTEARAVHFSNPSKPHGLQLDSDGKVPPHPFWGVSYYEYNDAEYVPPVDPPDDPPVDDPPVDPPGTLCLSPNVCIAPCPACPVCSVCPPRPQLSCGAAPREVRRTLEAANTWNGFLTGNRKARLLAAFRWFETCKP